MSAPSAVATIAAIASAAGAGGVGVVRVSGPAVPAIARTLLGRAPRPRHAHLAAIRDADGSLLDRVVLLYFAAPASYTGEHVLELQGHGSPVLLDALLARVCGLGARLARPGEFTERAFLNGKLDLAQAEAVADLIAARSRAGARAALRSLDGEFSRRVEALHQALVALRVQIEAALDFPDEAIEPLADPALRARHAALLADLAALETQARRGTRLTDSLRVAIVGRPNVGKSSLLNALAGEARAIVAAQAGTTRDVLRESVRLDEVTLELADTAGLRDTDDEVEREGVRRAQREAGRADLLLLVGDATDHAEDLAADFARLRANADAAVPVLRVLNKIDCADGVPGEETRDGLPCIRLSARTGAGLDLLRAALRRAAGAENGDGVEGTFSARRRHVAALKTAAAHLHDAGAQLASGAGELAAESLRQTQQALGEITGRYSSDDLLGAIFGAFCIGK